MASGIITQVIISGIKNRKDVIEMAKKKVTIYLDENTIKRLKIEALKEDKSLSKLLEEITQKALESSKVN